MLLIVPNAQPDSILLEMNVYLVLIIVKHVPLQHHVPLSKKVQDNSLSLLMEPLCQLFVILDASNVPQQVHQPVSHVKMVTIYLQVEFVLHVPPHAKHAVLLQQHVLLVMLMHSFNQHQIQHPV